MKKVLKIVSIVLNAIVFFILLYLVALVTLPYFRFEEDKTESPIYTCYLKSNGSHVDIVMPLRSPVHNWEDFLSQENIEYRDSIFDWVALGWGDKNFYLNTPTWSDLTFSTAFKAAFGLSSGAIHVTYYKELKESEHCVKFRVSDRQMKRLFTFILNDFEKDQAGIPVFIPTDMVYGPRDAFYNSNKRYSLFHTCNTWVNDALAYCDHRHCLWTALEFGVMDLFR
jgi:uncharacterized protein (TIGR02117 family)